MLDVVRSEELRPYEEEHDLWGQFLCGDPRSLGWRYPSELHLPIKDEAMSYYKRSVHTETLHVAPRLAPVSPIHPSRHQLALYYPTQPAQNPVGSSFYCTTSTVDVSNQF
jgi:hypothetical protein